VELLKEDDQYQTTLKPRSSRRMMKSTGAKNNFLGKTVDIKQHENLAPPIRSLKVPRRRGTHWGIQSILNNNKASLYQEEDKK
jgi:hypothetical protein